MEYKVARIISAVFHPLLLPTYLFCVLFILPVYFSLTLSQDSQLVLIGFIFLLTFIIPASLIVLMYKMRIVKTLTLTDRKDREFILLFTAMIFYITYHLLRDIDISGIFRMFIFCSFIIGLAAFFISLFFKISLHLIGMGSFCGAVIMLTLNYGINGTPILIVCLIVSGLTGYARIKLSAHSLLQVYTGFLAGMILFIAIFSISLK